MKPVLIALPVLLAATPALAIVAPAAFGGFAQAVATGTLSPAQPIQLGSQPVAAVTIGDLQVTLEQTALADVVSALGGDVRQQGEAGGHVLWSCYGVGELTLWFVSDGEMGDGAVTMVALEAAAPSPAWGCNEAPVTTQVDFGVPGFGSDLVEIAAAFGTIPDISAGALTYRSDTPVTDPAGFSVWQEIAYRLVDGRADAVAVTQQTGD